MSIVSNRHNVVPFVSGETKPFQNQRLAKIGYKDRGEKKAKFASVAVSVPVIDTSIDAFKMHANAGKFDIIVREALENAQDGIIRSLYESADGTLSSVSDDEISIDACLNYLEAERNGSRLTKELINEWFDSEVQDNLSVVIAQKLGFGDAEELNDAQMQVVSKNVKIYKDILSALAGGRTMLEPKQLSACEKAIELSTSEASDVAQKLKARIESMKNPKPLAEMLEL